MDVQQAAQEYFQRIHRAALVLTGNQWDADDLAQETFMIYAAQKDRFEGRSSLYTWLYGILLNLERRERRRMGIQRRKFQDIADGRQQTRPTTVPGADAPVEAGEWKCTLWARVSRLPDGQRQALALRFSEGLRYEEIAEILECPLGTVKSRIHNGLTALKRMMETEGPEHFSVPEHPREDMRNLG